MRGNETNLSLSRKRGVVGICLLDDFMKQKYYDTANLYVGFLGYVRCDENGAQWMKKKDCSCIIYEERLSETLDNAMEGYDVLSGNHYFFYNNLTSNKKNVLDIINGKYVICKGFPMNIILDKEKALGCELKSVLWSFNILDAMTKRSNDKILSLLKKEIDMTDSINNVKVRERFIDSIGFYVKEYIRIITTNEESSKEKNVLSVYDIKNQIKNIYN